MPCVRLNVQNSNLVDVIIERTEHQSKHMAQVAPESGTSGGGDEGFKLLTRSPSVTFPGSV